MLEGTATWQSRTQDIPQGVACSLGHSACSCPCRLPLVVSVVPERSSERAGQSNAVPLFDTRCARLGHLLGQDRDSRADAMALAALLWVLACAVALAPRRSRRAPRSGLAAKQPSRYWGKGPASLGGSGAGQRYAPCLRPPPCAQPFGVRKRARAGQALRGSGEPSPPKKTAARRRRAVPPRSRVATGPATRAAGLCSATTCQGRP